MLHFQNFNNITRSKKILIIIMKVTILGLLYRAYLTLFSFFFQLPYNATKLHFEMEDFNVRYLKILYI